MEFKYGFILDPHLTSGKFAHNIIYYVSVDDVVQMAIYEWYLNFKYKQWWHYFSKYYNTFIISSYVNVTQN